MDVNKHQKEIINSLRYLRIKDRHGHFLGEAKDGVIYIYCKRCKEFYILQDIVKADAENSTTQG